MKVIKTYEEFDLMNILTSPSTYIVGGLYLLQYIGPKILLKLEKKKRYKEILNNEIYTNSKWYVKEEGNIITIFRVLIRKKRIDFIIDKDNSTFEYVSDYSLKVKLNKKEMNDILSSVKFLKNINETIEECFYELSDNNFGVKLHNVNFYRKTFEILVSPINEGESINFKKLAPLLEETLYKITSIYGVKINKYYKINDIWARGGNYYYVSEYKEGYIKILNNEKGPIVYNSKKTGNEVSDLRTTLLLDIKGIFIGFL